MGKGDKTKFWLGRWTGNVSHKDHFNRLFQVETRKERVVMDKGEWQGEEWHRKCSCRREPMGREEGELEKLRQVLQVWKLKVGREDRVVWMDRGDLFGDIVQREN